MEFENNLHANVTVRRCGHCRNVGHRINFCHQALLDGLTLHNTILIIIQNNLNHPENIEQTIYLFMNSLNVSKLKLLIYINNINQQLNNFVIILFHNNLINTRESGLHTKRDLLKVLGLYYKQSYATYLQEFMERPELFLQFQVPVYYRPFDEENSENLFLESRKFTFEIQVQPSNKPTTFECPICMDETDDNNRITINCNHDVCHSCFDKYLTNLINTNLTNNNNQNPCCCLCRATVKSLTCRDIECCNILKEKFINK